MQFHTKPLTNVRFATVNALRTFSVVTVDRVLMWIERANGRRDLMKLDNRMLEDIGVSRFDAVKEAHKPFWQQ